MLHLFIQEFGADLSAMPTTLSTTTPLDGNDTETIRWCVRSYGDSAFLFVNNYARLADLPEHQNVQFDIRQEDETLTLPAEPITIPAGVSFIWPINLDLDQTIVRYATAQPITQVRHGSITYSIFSEVSGIPVEFLLDLPAQSRIVQTNGKKNTSSKCIRIVGISPGTTPAITIDSEDGQTLAIIVLTADQALSCWKTEIDGNEYAFLTDSELTVDGPNLLLRTHASDTWSVASLPGDLDLTCAEQPIESRSDGLFCRFSGHLSKAEKQKIAWTKIAEAGPARQIKIGSQGVAEAPDDDDFESAAIYRIVIPPKTADHCELMLRITYVGDVARIYHGEELLTDNFYNGTAFEIGLSRYDQLSNGGILTLKILPLRSDAPIYIRNDKWPEFHGKESAESLISVEPIFYSDVALEAH
jgi:hypothetical protein